MVDISFPHKITLLLKIFIDDKQNKMHVLGVKKLYKNILFMFEKKEVTENPFLILFKKKLTNMYSRLNRYLK